jgi:hypothetical protein
LSWRIADLEATALLPTRYYPVTKERNGRMISIAVISETVRGMAGLFENTIVPAFKYREDFAAISQS